MLLRLPLLAFAAVLAAPASVLAQPAPVCGTPEVLDRVAQIIAKAGSTALIDPGLVGQVPTAQPQTVACVVRLVDWYYDTPRYGLIAQPRTWSYGFTVRRGRNGLFVDPLNDR